MNMKRIPVLTFSLVAILIAIHALAPDRSVLWFGAEDIARGEIWRFFTGHLTHADVGHLWWNCLGLAVLGSLLECHSRSLLGITLAGGIIAVGILLLTPFSQLQYYCGLSGVLNTLLLVALWVEWRRSRSWLILLLAFCCIVKTAIEVSLGASVLTNISWPPYAWAHVAGLSGGVIVIWALYQPRWPPIRL
jgi:rhomboid family GlyGly-CTERM serine protease